MSQLIYNGIELNPIGGVGTLQYMKEAIFDGPNYLYTRHTLVVSAEYNPSQTSFIAGEVQPPLPVRPVAPLPGRLPPQTDEAIRHALLQPRQKLIYRNGGVDVINSPFQNHVSDATNGPFPISVKVARVVGEKLWLVEFAIRTDVNECETNGLRPPPILSHLWTSEEEYDQDFYATRTIQGRVVFHPARLRALAASPDEYRNSLWHPVPPGFKRDRVKVALSEDGLTLQYMIVDRQQATHLNQGNPMLREITRIEAVHTHTVNSPGLERLAVALVDAALGAAVGVVRAAPNPFAMVAEGLEVPAGIIRAWYKNLPTRTASCAVRLWGTKNSRRIVLNEVGARIVRSRLASVVGPAVPQHITTTHDIVGKFVEVSGQVLAAPVSNPVHDVGDWRDIFGLNHFPQLDGTNDTFVNIIADNRVDFGPAPNLPNRLRGHDARLLIAQELMGQCAVPAAPTLAPEANRNLDP